MQYITLHKTSDIGCTLCNEKSLNLVGYMCYDNVTHSMTPSSDICQIFQNKLSLKEMNLDDYILTHDYLGFDITLLG